MLFVLVQAVALVRLLWVRYPYRWFLLALALWVAQAVNTTYFPGATREWTATWWLYPEIALMLATSAACVETIERERSRMAPVAALQLRVASWAIPACIVGFGVRFVAPPTGDTLATFTGIRMWLWAFLALSLGVVVLLVKLRGNGISRHSMLLLVVLCAHALLSPFGDASVERRLAMRTAYRGTVILCCVIWAIGAKSSLTQRGTLR